MGLRLLYAQRHASVNALELIDKCYGSYVVGAGDYSVQRQAAAHWYADFSLPHSLMIELFTRQCVSLCYRLVLVAHRLAPTRLLQ